MLFEAVMKLWARSAEEEQEDESDTEEEQDDDGEQEAEECPIQVTPSTSIPCMSTSILGSFKSAPKYAGLMPDGSGRMAISFVAKQSSNPKVQAVLEADLRTEIQIFMKLQKHARVPGCNRIIEFVVERSCLGPQARLTLELVKPFGCDLFERRREMSPFTTTRAISQVCEGLGFLQSCCVVHGDLKCENVLLTSTNDIKLIDFGMAANVSETRKWPAGDNVPKRMRARTMPAEFSQDLYGVGFIIEQFMWGNKAFTNEVPQAKATKELLMSCRMTLDELVQEPWIGSVQSSRYSVRHSTAPASLNCTPLRKSSVRACNSTPVERLTPSTCSTSTPTKCLTPGTCSTDSFTSARPQAQSP
jgi:serine/threonine protein kinase